MTVGKSNPELAKSNWTLVGRGYESAEDFRRSDRIYRQLHQPRKYAILPNIPVEGVGTPEYNT
jgi:hypothetical protein